MIGSDSLTEYFNAISSIPLLTKQEEIDLFRRLQDGDGSARHQIAEANQRLVIKIAKSHLGRGLPFGDLIGEGNVGLMRAIDKFDLSRKCRLATYAIHWIRQAIIRGIQEKAPMVRPPVDLTGMVSRFRRTVSQLEQKLGRRPHIKEVARTIRVSAEKVIRLHQAERALYGIGPLPEFDAIDSVSVSRTGEDPSTRTDREIEARDMVEVLIQAVTDREREILSLRFGLDGRPPMTLRQVGERLHVTRARVGQIQSRAMAKMFAMLSERETLSATN